jgi:hypothetical protein
MKFINEKKKTKKMKKEQKRKTKKKKCVAYPQEDFLFTILHGDS